MSKLVDLIDAAIKNEIHAKVFYDKAAETTSAGETQMVFMDLAGMEDQHARRLVRQFGDLLRQEGRDPWADLERMENDTSNILDLHEDEAISSGEIRRVLLFAQDREAAARDNYLALASQLSDAGGKNLCADLAAEEQKHFDELASALVSLDMPLDERPML